MPRMPSVKRLPHLAAVVALLALGLPAAPAAAAVPGAECPDLGAVNDAGGLVDPVLSAHRGGTSLAPEHTYESYATAAAYGVDVLEIDVRTTADNQQVVIHDDTLERTTDVEERFPGRAPYAVRDFTLAEIRTLNAADYGPFRQAGPPDPRQTYNPALVPTVQEIVSLAGQVGAGIEADLKDAADPGAVVDMVEAAGILDRSFFGEPERPDSRARILAAAPDAQFIYNIGSEPPAVLTAIARTGVRYFGSALREFTPEVIAAIHEGCGLALPHAYDSDPPTPEDEDIRIGRARGTDGAQIDSPDVAVDAIDRPVATRLELRAGQACLVNDANGLGLPYQQLLVDGAAGPATMRGGCVALATSPQRSLRFTGTGAALPSALLVGGPAPVVPEAPYVVLIPVTAAVAAAFVAARRRRVA